MEVSSLCPSHRMGHAVLGRVPSTPRGNGQGIHQLQILVEFCIVGDLFTCSKQSGLPAPPEVKNKNYSGLYRIDVFFSLL